MKTRCHFFSFVITTFILLFLQDHIFSLKFVVTRENENKNSSSAETLDCPSFEIKILTSAQPRRYFSWLFSFPFNQNLCLDGGFTHLCIFILFLFRLSLLTKHRFVSCFADWVEFSPYEIGMAKYGTFMSPDLFGSKFFMGTVVKKYSENPLHFLMGEYVTERNFKIISAVHGQGFLNAITQSVRQEVGFSICWKTSI